MADLLLRPGCVSDLPAIFEIARDSLAGLAKDQYGPIVLEAPLNAVSF